MEKEEQHHLSNTTGTFFFIIIIINQGWAQINYRLYLIIFYNIIAAINTKGYPTTTTTKTIINTIHIIPFGSNTMYFIYTTHLFLIAINVQQYRIISSDKNTHNNYYYLW